MQAFDQDLECGYCVDNYGVINDRGSCKARRMSARGIGCPLPGSRSISGSRIEISIDADSYIQTSADIGAGVLKARTDAALQRGSEHESGSQQGKVIGIGGIWRLEGRVHEHVTVQGHDNATLQPSADFPPLFAPIHPVYCFPRSETGSQMAFPTSVPRVTRCNPIVRTCTAS